MNISVSDVPFFSFCTFSAWTITFFPNILIVYVFYVVFCVFVFYIFLLLLYCSAVHCYLSIFELDFSYFFLFVEENFIWSQLFWAIRPLGLHEIHRNCGLTTASNPFRIWHVFSTLFTHCRLPNFAFYLFYIFFGSLWSLPQLIAWFLFIFVKLKVLHWARH